jgi:hypothetical protein
MNTKFIRRIFPQPLAAMTLAVTAFFLSIRPAHSEPSVARLWDEEILAAIRIDLPHPPVHARNLFHFSVAMYDAWAAYDHQAVGYLYHTKHNSPDVAAARRQAVSFAAYRLLRERYSLSRGAATTLPSLDRLMANLGYDPGDLSQEVSTPVGVGNRVAAIISAYSLEDGARQVEGYADLPPDRFGYQSVNQPLIVTLPGILLFDVNRWQPLVITNGVTQNNIPADTIQTFLGAQWLAVRPFCLDRELTGRPWLDPGPPPRLGGLGDAEFRSNVVEVIRRGSELTPDDGVTLDVSPGGWGNHPLGSNDGAGHPLNPATGLPYPPNVVRRGDFVRVLAEFWADGPHSETPPGHWNVLANQVTEHPAFSKRLGGTGPVLDDLEWDVKLYFALNAALHDAACAAWSLKRYYDGWRPISAIRYQGELGQSSDPAQPHYHSKGLPLIPDLIEIVTAETAKPGGRHAGIAPNTLVIRNWPGQPSDPTNSYSGVRWISPGSWVPYQKRSFVTPAFPGYVSGHSTFSRAAAEVLAAITGSDFFPGGMGVFTAPAGTYLTFEKGPSEAVNLQWGTYFDAADQAGLSRLWGGIHPPVDDFAGRRVGSTCGQAAWALAKTYFDGSVLSESFALSYRIVRTGRGEVRFPTKRGLTYMLQSASDPSGTFVNDPAGPVRAVDAHMTETESTSVPNRFYRVLRTAE